MDGCACRVQTGELASSRRAIQAVLHARQCRRCKGRMFRTVGKRQGFWVFKGKLVDVELPAGEKLIPSHKKELWGSREVPEAVLQDDNYSMITESLFYQLGTVSNVHSPLIETRAQRRGDAVTCCTSTPLKHMDHWPFTRWRVGLVARSHSASRLSRLNLLASGRLHLPSPVLTFPSWRVFTHNLTNTCHSLPLTTPRILYQWERTMAFFLQTLFYFRPWSVLQVSVGLLPNQ